MKNIQVPKGYEDYMMKIEFSDIKTGRTINKNIFYNEREDKFSVIDDDKNIIFITDQDFYKTIENFKEQKEVY